MGQTVRRTSESERHADFLSLKNIQSWDAFFYVVAQFAGGLLGVLLAEQLLGAALRHATVNYVVRIPGKDGAAIAFLAEFVISAFLMLTVLVSSNCEPLAPFTGLVAGVLIAVYVSFEAPLERHHSLANQIFRNTTGVGSYGIS